MPCPSLGGGNETARVHHAYWRRGSCVAARGACAAVGDAGDRIPERTIGAGIRSRRGIFPPWPERGRLRRGSERRDRISLGGGTTGSAAAARRLLKRRRACRAPGTPCLVSDGDGV